MKKIFFFHITKTAGTSLRNLLLKNYGENQIYDSCANSRGPNAGSDLLYENNLDLFPQKNCFMGHYRSNILPIIPNSFFRFTFLREPVSRAVSWFYYLKKSNHFTSPLTLEEFFFDVPIQSKYKKTATLAYFKQATNVYVRSFTNNLGKDINFINQNNYTNAITNMHYYFDFIGFLEKYNESTFILSKLCNFDDIFYEKLNVISKPKSYRNYRKELGDELFNQIISYNKYDVELYSYARNITKDFYKNFISKNLEEFEKSKNTAS
ncbi:sulfotransferase family 2 domain-containing protein [Desulfovibrio gilichinskyi]|uniref:Sulfotransferase family protein n=1 Tax=Desulfovibrio gilichinskyi TaxID=1519643 RepID=A0A1X7CSJ3_9BACT|nr:sulfotransferase family 2 domain-containing protein [Desulfovibrio gilichinskyi]SMF02294.1 Sulfotransferase family protein [Desulfovibrio gilichinskyi]